MGGACWASPSASPRALRAARLSIDIGASVDFARALTLVDIGDREQVRGAGAAIFVRRRDDRATYEAVFDRWWRRRGSRLPGAFEPPPIGGQDGDADQLEGAASPQPGDGSETTEQRPDEAGVPLPASDDQDAEDEAPIAGIVISPDAYSQGEVLRHREFDRMTPRGAARGRAAGRPARAEARAPADAPLRAPLARPAARAARDVPAQPRDRRPAARLGLAAPDPRAALARRPVRHLRLDGAPFAAAAPVRPGAVRGSEVRTESFVFGTRLTRVTRLLKDRDRDRALARVSDAVNDWAGGTRIGESFRTFNQQWARRTLRTSGVVIVVSDGWDRGDPALVGDRDRPPAAQLPPAGLAQSAGRHARLPAARRRDACRLPVRRRLPGRPGPSPTSSGSGRSSAASEPATRGAAARPPRTRRSPGWPCRPSPRHPTSSAGRRPIHPQRGRSDEGAARHPGRLGA